MDHDNHCTCHDCIVYRRDYRTVEEAWTEREQDFEDQKTREEDLAWEQFKQSRDLFRPGHVRAS